MEQEKTCKDLVRHSLKSRFADIKTLFDAECNGEESVEDLGSFNEYGLSFDYVGKETFKYQKKTYFRYQISYGGPSEEFRFYVNEQLDITKIEFWYLDWYDGACIKLTGKKLEYMTNLFNLVWLDTGTVQHLLDKDREERKNWEQQKSSSPAY